MTRYVAVLACLVGTVACADFGPSEFSDYRWQLTNETLPGTYVTTVFSSTTPAGGYHDLVRAGASLTLILAPGGKTTGRLVRPGGNEDGTDLRVCMTGTWTLNGFDMTLSQPAATFVREMTFSASKEELYADKEFATERIRVRLQRTTVVSKHPCAEA